jgi:hypothetical protein
MRISRIMIGLALIPLAVIMLLGPWPWRLFNRQYFGWRYKSTKYYADFTAACDSVLAKHPLGRNEFILIPITDPSLPPIITDAHPIKIKISSECFWMLLGSDSHWGYGLTWTPQWEHTNVWVLYTTAESLETVLYTSEKFIPPSPAPDANLK